MHLSVTISAHISQGVELYDAKGGRKSEAQRAKREASMAAAAERNESVREGQAKKHFNEVRAWREEEKPGVAASRRVNAWIAGFRQVRHLVVALGDHAFLRLQPHAPIAKGHVVIEPVEHAASLADAPEEVRPPAISPRPRASSSRPRAFSQVADEVRNFQKCLIRQAHEQARSCR